jgi:hypothetical protein
MKKGTVKFSKEFKTIIGTSEWVGIEMEYDMSTECPRDVLTNAKTIVEQWRKESNSGANELSLDELNIIPPGPPPVISVERTSEDVRIAELIRGMYACTKLDGDDGLFSFYTLASAHVETKAVYDVVKNKLVSKESKELLDAANAHTVSSLNKKQNK